MKLSSKKLKVVTLGLGSVLMMGAGQTAFAHASILNAITSGATGFSRVGVNHADNHTSPPTPILAQSVVWPTVSPILASTRVGAPAVIALGDYFATSAAAATTTGLLPWTTIANAPQLVQSKDIFALQIEQANGLNQTIGWVSSKGSLQVNLNGEIPFRFAAPHFRSVLPAANPNGLVAADLCVSALVIQVAVADIADPTVQPPYNPANYPTVAVTTLPGIGTNTTGMQANLWVSNATPGLGVAPNVSFPPAVIEDGAATPKLTINRDTTINPYPTNCVPAGGADPVFQITVFPSAADIEALQFPGWGTVVPGNTYR